MLKDTLDKVKAAEKSADNFIVEARKKADEIIRSAESDAEKTKSDAASKAEKDYQTKIAAAKGAAEQKAGADAAEIEKEMFHYKASVSGNSEVIDQILKKILN